MKRNNVVYITDVNYVMPTVVSIVSLVNNLKERDKYNIYVIMVGLKEQDKNKFECIDMKGANLHLVNFTGSICSAGKQLVRSHVSSTALAKFQIANILADKKRALYLDCDVIVNGDISDVFGMEIAEYYLAAVDDMGDCQINGKSKLASQVGIDGSTYFNSGVMYLNLEKLRQDDMHTKLLDYHNNGVNYFVDQDALNVVLGMHRMPLTIEYNFRSVIFDALSLDEFKNRFGWESIDSIDDAFSKAKIVHMTSRYKPWLYNQPWCTEIFMKYYNLSVYGNERLRLLSPIKDWRDKAINESGLWWKFPYQKVAKGSRVIVYGAGRVGNDYMEQIKESKYCNVIAWVDADGKKWNDLIHSPDIVCELVYDAIIIAVNGDEIKDSIREKLVCEYCVDVRKIIM